MELDIYQVDSFTTEPFKGNPAGVCISQEPLPEALMFSIAEEMAVSETAFLCLKNRRLRWFTPKVEVALCGHGTLATAQILKEKGLANVGDTIEFQTLSGELNAKVNPSTIALDFPSTQLEMHVEHDAKILAGLGLRVEQIVSYGQFDGKGFIEVDSEQTVLDLAPNFEVLKNIRGRGVVVTAQSNSSDLDFISRYFAPWVGVNEDPVTGSAHCALTQFWSQKLGQTQFRAYQASARGGHLQTELLENGRIKLVGSATTVNSGKLKV
ncbi:PhzF family phenazine biosynthesis protein [Vibrio hyugaensis]|uniref:PhzF family phenazine biosynthesis protein n=1 Tax=Vibrio hyugaensis TaxID=1534743 RepID=UPI0005ED538F|nr:PhzF family phenazine biosynthesis protein [Vibrio hyugaensis]